MDKRYTGRPLPPRYRPMSALLEVDDLRVRFRARGPLLAKLSGAADVTLDAVLGVSFRLEPGATFGLVGESGSGKSTLGRAIMGMLPVHSGRVRFMGLEQRTCKGPGFRSWRRNMAMMFQDPVASLSPRLTVGSLITEPHVIHHTGNRDLDAEARRLLDMVGLPADFAGRYPHQLSGGQARRVGVARALALEPKVIIADEPTAGLDVSVQGEILNLLARLQRELGLAYVIITHNLPVVRHMCDEMAIMYMGRFVEHGPTDKVFARPLHPYTYGLLEAQPRPDPADRRHGVVLAGEVPSLIRRPSGCEFHTRCPRAQDLCRSERPAAQGHGSGRELRCHFPLG